MRVLPVDLRVASSKELAHMLAVRRACRGRPDLPEPARDRAAPGRRIACWLSYDDDQPVGTLSLVLPAEVQCGYVRLDVDPGRRREGAARQLLTEAVRMSWSLGRAVLHGRCEPDGPGSGFARAVGAMPGGFEDLLRPPPGGASPVPDGVAVLEITAPDTGVLAAIWAPDARPAPDAPMFHAVHRASGATAGLAGRDEDGLGFVALAADADLCLGAALAVRLAGTGDPSATLSVWVPRTDAVGGPVFASRIRWSLAVPGLAARLGMC